MLNLYNEKAGILDGDADGEVDLASLAYQIWKNAIDRDPALEKDHPGMPNVVFSTQRAYPGAPSTPEGVWSTSGQPRTTTRWPGLIRDGKSVTESQFAILKAAECAPDTPALPRHERHHELVASGGS